MLAWLSISIVAIIHHITSDDQLPLLILVIVESPLTNVIAQVQFMDDFDFMHSRNNELEYGSFLFLIFSYCFASFSTAVDFLKLYKVQRKQFTLQPATRLSPTEDFGLEGWAPGIHSVFNDILTQTSLEPVVFQQSSSSLRSSSVSSQRSTSSSQFDTPDQQGYWWSRDLERQLR